MINAFYNPVEALHDAKADESIGTTFIVLLIAAVALILAQIIATGVFSIYAVLGIIVTVVVSALVGALLLKIAMAILGAKEATYFAALTAITYSIAPLTAALLISAVLILIPVIGMILAALLIMVASVAMGATLIRGVMELGHADLLLALVCTWVVMGLGMLAVSLSMGMMGLMLPMGMFY